MKQQIAFQMLVYLFTSRYKSNDVSKEVYSEYDVSNTIGSK